PNSTGWGDGAAALAEPDRHKTLAAAVRAHDDHVAILEEAACLPRGERQRSAAAGGDLEQAAEAVIGGRRDRAGPEPIARAQIAAATTVVRHPFGPRPVEGAAVAGAQGQGAKP